MFGKGVAKFVRIAGDERLAIPRKVEIFTNGGKRTAQPEIWQPPCQICGWGKTRRT